MPKSSIGAPAGEGQRVHSGSTGCEYDKLRRDAPGADTNSLKRPHPPLPVTEPTFDLPKPEPRNYMGWVLLAAVFGFLIIAQLSQYLGRPVDKAVADTERLDTVLRGVVIQREAVRTLGMFNLSKEPAAGSSSVTRSLEDEISRLAGLRSTDVEAAKYYAAMRTESGSSVEAGDLAVLSTLPTPTNRVFRAIYTADKLSVPEARELGKTIGDATFLNKLAGVHALEKAGVKQARGNLITPAKAALLLTTLLALGACMLLGLVLWPVYFAARSAGKLTPLGHPCGMLDEPQADRHALRAAQFLLAMVGLMVVTQPLTQGLPSWASGSIYSLALLTAVVLISRTRIDRHRIGLGHLGWSSKNFGKNVLWGVGGAVANIPIVAILGFLGVTAFRFLPAPQHPASMELLSNPSLLVILSTLFSASLMAPLIEETAFRGALLPAMSSVFRNVAAGILATSLLFAAVHPTGIPAWPALAGVGAMAAMLTYQTKSLVPAIVMHAVHNFATLMLALSLGN